MVEYRRAYQDEIFINRANFEVRNGNDFIIAGEEFRFSSFNCFGHVKLVHQSGVFDIDFETFDRMFAKKSNPGAEERPFKKIYERLKR